MHITLLERQLVADTKQGKNLQNRTADKDKQAAVHEICNDFARNINA